MAEAQQLIVADIGGTNARFAIARRGEDGATTIDTVRTFTNSQFTAVDELLGAYMVDLEGSVPTAASLAIAGPNDGKTGYMVNLGWHFDAQQIATACHLQQVHLVNDFSALALGIPGLAEADSRCLQIGQPHGNTLSICGPGTGLGVAALILQGDKHLALATEGGHVAFSACSELEQRLHSFYQPGAGFLPVEYLLSGRGLPVIYQFLCSEAGQAAEDLDPYEVGTSALDGSRPLCQQAVLLFLTMLGTALGDFVLAHGATAGMYIGGGIVPRFADLIEDSELLQRFCEKGPMSDYMEKVPLHLITADYVALKGAAESYWQGCN